MDYLLDLDPAHLVIRLTVTAEIMTPELAEDIHARITRFSSGVPFAAIFDLSAVRETTLPTEMIRTYAHCDPSVPMGRPRVIVGAAPVIYGLARLFQICGESVNKEYEVVHSVEAAYGIVGVRPEDFTQHLFPERMAA